MGPRMVLDCAENLTRTGSIPGPSSIESLYGLRYPGPFSHILCKQKCLNLISTRAYLSRQNQYYSSQPIYLISTLILSFQ